VRGAHLKFIDNNAEGLAGGAMYLTSYTQVILFQGSTFDFINNTGRCAVCVFVHSCHAPGHSLPCEVSALDLSAWLAVPA